MKKAFYLAALLSLFSPLAIDMYLGLMSVIEAEYNKSAALTLSVFLFGLGVGQIVSGVMNDKKGLSFLVLFSLLGYVATSGGIFFFTSYYTLLVFRFLQGVFAGGLALSSILFINLSFQGYEKQKYLGYQQSVMNAIPATAPAIGALLYESTHSWRASFLVLAVVGSVCFIWLWKNTALIPQSASDSEDKGGSFNKEYVINGAIAVLSLGGLFTYVSAFPFVIESIGFSQFIFVVAFALNALFIILGGMFSGRYSKKWGAQKLLIAGLVLQFISAVMMLTGRAFYPALLSGFALFCFSFPITISSSMALCLSGMQSGRGKLLGYITCLQMCAGGLGGYVVSQSTPSLSFSILLITITLVSAILLQNKNVMIKYITTKNR